MKASLLLASITLLTALGERLAMFIDEMHMTSPGTNATAGVISDALLPVALSF